jgi:hypothetical protein
VCTVGNLSVAAGGLTMAAPAAVGAQTVKARTAWMTGATAEERSLGAKQMLALRNNSTLRWLGKVGRSEDAALLGKSMAFVGGALTFAGVYGKTGNVGVAATDAVGDTAISWAATTTGTELGIAIGSAIAPGVGTLIGAGIGAVAGTIAGAVGSGEFNRAVSAVASWI